MASSSIQKRLGKKGPFASPQQEVSLGLLYVADRIGGRVSRLLRGFGLTESQYNVLRILRGEGKPLPALEVAKRMIHAVPAITGLVDRLEKQGLVVRQRCEHDRRVVHLEATKKALNLIAKIDEPLAELHTRMLGGLTKKDLSAFRELLNKTVDLIEAD